ncbi:MAG: nicotinate-nucleotide adenylyltransferase [Candidatus Omnitrophica bacterium]|nr:nicotinate-nucleotide adenylyltransferase [Candidatus Omnitrophota bacterium]
MNIGILGGTFDPIHAGHLVVAETARESLGLEKVLFVPAGVPVHRGLTEASGEDRYRMVLLAIEGNPRFAASDFEIRRQGPSFSYETIRHFSEQYGSEAKFYLILGADAFQEIGTWYKINSLARLVTFVVAGREHARHPENLPEGVKFQELAMGFFSVSGHDVRQRMKEGGSIRYLVSEPVRQYIIEHDLYR